MSNGLLTECAVIFSAEPLSRLLCFHSVLTSHSNSETVVNSTAQHNPPGGAPHYISYIDMCALSGRVFAPFWSENGYTPAHFGLESGWFFRELRECMNVLIVSIPNE